MIILFKQISLARISAVLQIQLPEVQAKFRLHFQSVSVLSCSWSRAKKEVESHDKNGGHVVIYVLYRAQR